MFCAASLWCAVIYFRTKIVLTSTSSPLGLWVMWYEQSESQSASGENCTYRRRNEHKTRRISLKMHKVSTEFGQADSLFCLLSMWLTHKVTSWSSWSLLAAKCWLVNWLERVEYWDVEYILKLNKLTIKMWNSKHKGASQIGLSSPGCRSSRISVTG